MPQSAAFRYPLVRNPGYERLTRLCDTVNVILVTPNTLTEASNLLAQHGEPERSRFFRVLRALIGGSKEIVVSSKKASGNEVFERLGLTDAALLEAVSAQTPLITVDLDLYHAALANGREAVINFTHFQSW